MQLLSSDARNTTALAISSGVPSRPSGMLVEIVFLASDPGTISLKAGVSVGPGLTALTRMRRSLRSAVHVRANERTAALLALRPLSQRILACRNRRSEDGGRAIWQQWKRLLHREKDAFHIDVEYGLERFLREVPSGAYLVIAAFANTTSSLPFSR